MNEDEIFLFFDEIPPTPAYEKEMIKLAFEKHRKLNPS